MREQPVDPHDPCPYRADHGQNHRHCRMSHSAKRPRDQVHDAAKEIRHRGNGQYFQAALDHGCIRRIDSKKLRAEHISAYPQHSRCFGRQDDTVNEHPVHTFLLSHAVVLAGKAHARLCHGINRHIQKAEDIVCRRISSHSRGAE